MSKFAHSRRVLHYGDRALGVIEIGQPTGRDFVLVHGIGVSSRYFMPLAEELAQKATVYVLDLPGFGTMPKPRSTMSIADHAALINEFLKEHRIESPVLVGNSMGCQIIVEMLTQEPLASSKIILVGPVVNTKERTPIKQAMRLFQDGFHEPPYVNWIVWSDYFRCGIGWYFKTLPHMIHYPIEENIAKVQAEVRILRGAQDPIVSLEWATRLSSRAPRSTVREIPDIGHIAMYKRATQVARECLEL